MLLALFSAGPRPSAESQTVDIITKKILPPLDVDGKKFHIGLEGWLLYSEQAHVLRRRRRFLTYVCREEAMAILEEIFVLLFIICFVCYS